MIATLVLLAQLMASTTSMLAPGYVSTPPPTGRIALKYHTLTLVGSAPANGDNDGYADAGETNDLTLTLVNKTGLDLTNLVATMATTDATVDCLNPYQVTVPTVSAGATFTTPAFRFKIADTVNRTSIDDRIEATFTVSIHADQFPVLARPMKITFPLDLDVSGGGSLTTFLEDFEGASGLGKFTLQTLDAGKNSLAASDGLRCQYNDPAAPNSNDPTNSSCYLGFTTDPPLGVNDWHLHTSSAANGGLGRAYTGSQSMHWGVHPNTTPHGDTYRTGQLDAVKSVTINVPVASQLPELSFAQQISLVDWRGITSMQEGETADRAIVEVNVLKANGLEGPLWKKIYPYTDDYDELSADYFSACTFDPTDDGNDEDSYFDPNDPNRRYGPSSTCRPEFSYACQGDTDYHVSADPPKPCNAEGPAYKSADGVGSWVVPAFSLQEFAGRRIKVRFLGSSTAGGSDLFQTWGQVDHSDDDPTDDGWYIDTVKIAPINSTAPALVPDTKSITPLPCATCSSIQGAIVATPPSTPEPGALVTLDASGSTVGVACKVGPPQYTFWIDENADGVAGDAGDTLLRATADDPTLLIAPEASAQVAVVVSCRTEPACDSADGSNTAETLVTVDCPPGIDRTAFGQTIVIDKLFQGFGLLQISWPIAKRVDILKGCLTGQCAPAPLRDSGTFEGTVFKCLASDAGPINAFSEHYVSDEPYPPLADVYYYLVRGRTSACTQSLTGYSTNTPSEHPGRDTEIEADPNTCP